MSLSPNFQKVKNKILVEGEQQALLVQLGQLALSDISPVDLMKQAAQFVLQAIPVDYSLFWELLPDEQSLLFMAGAGLEEEGLSGRVQVPLDPGYMEGLALISQSPIVVENLEELMLKPSGLIQKEGVSSGVFVLIGMPEKPYGVLEVFSKQMQSFSEYDIYFLHNIANLIGMVLHKARHEEDLVAKNQTLRKELARVQLMTPSGHFEWDRYEIKNRLIESREKERLRLAQELHDVPIQDLYGLIYQLDDLRDVLKDSEGMGIINECDHTLHRVVENLRNICRDLRPPSLSPFGLEVAIRDHVEKFREQYPAIEVNLDLMQDKQVLSDGLRLTLFRVYQQAIHNIARHAQATKAHIRFRLDDEMITLEVEDDGIGFELPKQWMDLVQENHFGLLGIAERVESMHGKLEIRSAPGNGTLVRAVIPRS